MVSLHAVLRGTWQASTQAGHDPNGRLLGMVVGSIGTEIAKRARAFGMNVQYHNRRPLPQSEANYDMRRAEELMMATTRNTLTN